VDQGREFTFPPRLRARLENGRFGGPLGAAPVGDPADGLYETYLYDSTSKIVAVEVAAETICGEDSIDFEFKNVALP
jgi:hypothetical protein